MLVPWLSRNLSKSHALLSRVFHEAGEPEMQTFLPRVARALVPNAT
jgi:hypothetical protein